MTDETTTTDPAPDGPMFDPPADTREELATGYAVYDRRLGRYVGGVTADKPAAKDAKAAAKGHPYAIVRV